MDGLSFDSVYNFILSGGVKGIFIQVFVMYSIAILIDFFQRRTINKIKDKLDEKHYKFIYLNATLSTLRVPVSFFLYIMATTVSLDLINHHLNISLIQKFVNLRGIGIIACIGYFTIRFIGVLKTYKVAEIDEMPDKKGDKTGIQVYSNIAVIISFVIFGLMILQELGLSVSGLMAFGGIGGLIAGLSAKELLSDFFGGLVLMTDKPFMVGDWIRSPERDIEGVVEEIGMRRICVRTFDKRPLYIPNSIMSTITIENPSRMTNRRISETIGIRYQDADKMSGITRKIKDMLEKHSGIDANQTLMVNFNQFNDSSLDFFIYTFTKTTDWQTFHGIKHNILLNIYEIIKEEGAEIAYPTSIIHIEKENKQPK